MDEVTDQVPVNVPENMPPHILITMPQDGDMGIVVVDINIPGMLGAAELLKRHAYQLLAQAERAQVPEPSPLVRAGARALDHLPRRNGRN